MFVRLISFADGQHLAKLVTWEPTKYPLFVFPIKVVVGRQPGIYEQSQALAKINAGLCVQSVLHAVVPSSVVSVSTVRH